MMILGILGDERVAHSKSPAMHTAVLAEMSLEGVYLPFAVRPEMLASALEGIKALGLKGVNVTVPHKQGVAALVDELSPQARSLGAVNTLTLEGGVLKGDNTDVGGFGDALEAAGFEVRGQTALVLGAGGAARAVVAALGQLGASRVAVAGRSKERVRGLTDELGGEALDLEQGGRLAPEAGLLVNTTSVSSPAESPKMASYARGLSLSNCGLLVDINYGRKDNFWASLAKGAGVPFSDGLAMLACQARRSFIIWTGLEPALASFQRVLEEKA